MRFLTRKISVPSIATFHNHCESAIIDMDTNQSVSDVLRNMRSINSETAGFQQSAWFRHLPGTGHVQTILSTLQSAPKGRRAATVTGRCVGISIPTCHRWTGNESTPLFALF